MATNQHVEIDITVSMSPYMLDFAVSKPKLLTSTCSDNIL